MSSDNIWLLFELHETALMIASEKGYYEIAQLLLDQKGIDINATDINLFCLMLTS